MKNKLAILALFSIFLVSNVSSQTFSVDTQSEWDTGSFYNTTSESPGDLKLEKENVTTVWKTDRTLGYSNNVRDVEYFNGYAYFIVRQANEIAKVNASNGNIVDTATYNIAFQSQLEVGNDNYLYLASPDEEVKRIDPSDLSESTSNSWPVTGGAEYHSLAASENFLVAANQDDYMQKIDYDGNVSINKSISDDGNPVEIGENGNVFFAIFNSIKKMDSSLTLTGEEYNGDAQIRDIDRGPDGDLFAGVSAHDSDPSNDYVVKLDSDLNAIWENGDFHNDSIAEISVNSEGDVVSAAKHSDDNITLHEGEDSRGGEVIYTGVPNDTDSKTAIVSNGRDFIAGIYGTNGYSMIEYHFYRFSQGNYISRIFDDGNEKVWNEFEAGSTLNSQIIEANVSYSNKDFSTVRSYDTFTLNDGTENYSLSGNSRDVRVDLTFDGTLRKTPVMDYFSIYGSEVDTEIVSPDNQTWQNDDFTINVSDSVTASTCEYQAYETGTSPPAVWYPRTCDGTQNIDLSKYCSENGYNKCKVRVRASDGGTTETETHLYHLFNSSIECGGANITACYKFEAGSGQTVFDYARMRNHGSIGPTFQDEGDEPVWVTDQSDCFSGGCINFSTSSQVRVRNSENLSIGKFSVTGAAMFRSGDISPDHILHKENEFVIAMDDEGNLSAAVYNNSVCGGWCGNQQMAGFSEHFVMISDLQFEFGVWNPFRITWNGTHFAFYDEDGLVDTESPPSVNSKTLPENSTAPMLMGSEGISLGSHLSGSLDEIKIGNSSNAGVVPGSYYCTESQSGLYQNIGEEAELSGRIKNDNELCASYSGRTDQHWWDQDFGDIDKDGVQETCNTDGRTRWISKQQVWENPHAFTGGIDDDWTAVLENWENLGIYSHNSSRPENPDQATSGSDISSVPTGVLNREKIATIGFCGGDDEGEHLVTQTCESNLCETNSSVIGVANSPKSCVLSPDVRGNPKSERHLFGEGESVELDIGPENEEIACFDGSWHEKWPVTLTQGSKEVELGGQQRINIKIINIAEEPVTYQLSKEGPISRFVEFSGDASDGTVTVGARTSKDVTATLNGVKLGNNQDLTIQAVSQDGELSGEDMISIDTVESSGGSTDLYANIPGITGLEILLLGLASFTWFILDL